MLVEKRKPGIMVTSKLAVFSGKIKVLPEFHMEYATELAIVKQKT
jgi:hypothetical protein